MRELIVLVICVGAEILSAPQVTPDDFCSDLAVGGGFLLPWKNISLT